MTIVKRVLAPDRVRRPPREGWSWIDRRFLREYSSRLSRDAILLYFFLAAVGDKYGLSFYSDASIAMRLRIDERVVVRAREELETEDLVVYRAPLTQVLSLPLCGRRRQGGALLQFGEILRSLESKSSQNESGKLS
jgi:hypothetical protein